MILTYWAAEVAAASLVSRCVATSSRARRAWFVLLVAAEIAGFLIDLVIGGGRIHVFAWMRTGGGVLIVGIDALHVYTARQLRSIVVTDDDLLVGEESVSVTILGRRCRRHR